MRIYQTDNMEAALHQMVIKDDKVIVFKKHWCKRRIKLRNNLLLDIPITTAPATSQHFDRQVQRWNKNKGLLIYTPNMVLDKMPRAPSMLFVEAPLSYRVFEKYITRIERDVVIYRPPNWNFQDERLNFKLPRSADLHTVLAAVDVLRNELMSVKEIRALKVSGFVNAAVFSGDTIEAITGLKYSQIRKLFTRGFVGYFRWYQPYTLLYEPEEPWLLECYRDLENQLQEGLLRNDRFTGSGAALRVLVRQGAVYRSPPVYVLRDGYNVPDYGMLDALNNARRGDWYKMRMIVENADEYPINHQTQFAQSASNEYVAPLVDNDDSVR